MTTRDYRDGATVKRSSASTVSAESEEGRTLADLADEFCRRTDIAPKTRAAYRADLIRFRAWAAERDLDRPELLTPDVVDAYARHLEGVTTRKGAPLADASRRAYLKGVQQLLSWLAQRHRVEGIDARAVPLPRLRKRARNVLSWAEIQQLEDAAPTERNKLLIRVMAETGTREAGVAGIKMGDIVSLDGRTFIRVYDKTGERLPPVTPALYRRLKAHAAGKTGRPRSDSPYLFLSSRRRPEGDYEPLTEDGVYQAVKDAAARAGFERRVYPHLLKHSAISWMCHSGLHPAVISEVTGTSVAVIAAHYYEGTHQGRYDAVMRAMRELDA